MSIYKIVFAVRSASAAALVATVLSGCNSKAPAVDDATLNSQVQTRLASDQNLAGQPIQAAVSNGVVTLNGIASSDAARSLASGDAAQVAGVRTVVNNLVVQPLTQSAAASMAAVPEPMPAGPGEKVRKPSPSSPKYTPQPAAPVVRNAPQVSQEQYPAPATVAQAPPPAAPPTPVIRHITLPAGTSIPVRITQTLDSSTTQQGDKFTGAIASDIIVDGLVVLPQGTSVTGHVDAAQDAAHFKGSSLLTISLSSITRRGERLEVATEPYTKQGEGRGKNTAEKVGGGAAVGAILGGIFGGGKGAAIGAAAGGGVGAGANGITRGQQVQIPSESVIRFKLSDGIIVQVTTGGSGNSGGGLERRNQNQ